MVGQTSSSLKAADRTSPLGTQTGMQEGHTHALSRRTLTRRAGAASVAGVAGLGGSAAFLAACRLGGATSGDGSSSTISKPPVTLNILGKTWAAPTFNAAYDEVTRKFTAANPNITVAIDPAADFLTKLPTLVASGSSPDSVIWMDDQRIPQLGATGVAASLTDLIKRDKYDLTAFFPQATYATTFREKTYGLPYYWDMRLLYVNRQVFRDAGANPDSPPKTWAELDSLSETLTRRDGGQLTRMSFLPMRLPSVPIAFGGNTFLFLWAFQNNAEFTSKDLTKITLDTPPILEVMEWCKRWVERFGGHSAIREFASRVAVPGAEPLTTGRLAMTVRESGVSGTVFKSTPEGQAMDLGFAPAPYSKTPATWSGVLSTILPNGSARRDVAWQFMKHLASAESQLYFGQQVGWLPTRQSVAKDPFFAKDPESKAAIAVMPTTRVRPPVPASVALWDNVLKASNDALTGTVSARDALRQAQEATQLEMDKYPA
jgi:multiple sugar transport system substrate-binding protein